jgi:hypothetical protein
MDSGEIEPIVNRALEEFEFDEKTEKWILISIILSDVFLLGFPEISGRSSKGTVIEFRLHIPHSEFKRIDAMKQMAMIFDALSRSVDLIPKLKVSPESQEKFRTALATARGSFFAEIICV